MNSRAGRLGLGLVALIPVLGILGGVLVSADVGSATGWILLAVGVAWLLLTIWWAQRVPAERSGAVASRVWFAPRQDQGGNRNDHGR